MGGYAWMVRRDNSPFFRALWDDFCPFAIGRDFALGSASHYSLGRVDFYFRGRGFLLRYQAQLV